MAPNGLRLSCGRNARGRKELEESGRLGGARQRNSSLLVRAATRGRVVRTAAHVPRALPVRCLPVLFRFDVDHYTWLTRLHVDEVSVSRVPHLDSDRNSVWT